MQREKNGARTIERFSPPQTSFCVIGIDGSTGMLEKAKENLRSHKNLALAHIPLFMIGDMHDLHALGAGSFAGIWSCTALFTHTPRQLLGRSLQSVAALLKTGGMFFASYTNGKVTDTYDKLLASSTGRIKYFSQPDPEEIAGLAEEHGLRLLKQSTSDFEMNGKVVQRDLFASQFFLKE